MAIQLTHSQDPIKGSLQITGSKSESNRLLILQALYPEIEIGNLSNSDDTRLLQKALQAKQGAVDIHHAGTAMRFLTAYYAVTDGAEVVLTGSKRMQERPVRLLVDALRDLGADIEYEKEEGFPPLRIKGKQISGDKVKVAANISSQYISALMLIAPSLPKGLEISLEGQVTSVPYINMTLELLHHTGIEGSFSGNNIIIQPKKQLISKTLHVESDWSSASYFYSMAAISPEVDIKLFNYRKSSLQGDSCITGIYEQLGVETIYDGNALILRKRPCKKPARLLEDLRNSPDIAQTIAVTCLALGVECELNGLHTLKIKETDRLVALKNEMEKFGAKVMITQDSLRLVPPAALRKNVRVATYHDHRMAMAFAPLALQVPVEIGDAGVVSKSYPRFWEDLEQLGFRVHPVD